jgi:TonB-dependent SusC/RagA subfamily outer membrane receptor
MAKSHKSLTLLSAISLTLSLQAQVNNSLPGASADSVINGSEITNCLSCTQVKDRLSSATRFEFKGHLPTNELSVYDYLQGRVSGLDIISASDGPGKDAQATLRGANLYGGRSPLIVIDGIPQISTDRAFNQLKKFSEDIRSLIPVALEDIQSIEVLKDGASISLYGAEGADGVILIETKKGGAKKLGLTYECNQSYVQEPSYFPMLNGKEYCMYQAEAWHNYDPSSSFPEEISYDPNFSEYYNYSANTDWVKSVSQPGYASGNLLSFYGSNKKSRYYGSINYQDQKGTVINTKYNRVAGRLNFEHYFTSKLTGALNLAYTHDKFNGNPFGPNQKTVLEKAFEKAPNMSIWEYDAAGNPTGSYFSPDYNYQGRANSDFNPSAVAYFGSAVNKFDVFLATAHIQYRLNKWVQFKESFTYNNTSGNSDVLLPGEAITTTYPDTRNNTDLDMKRYRNQLQACFRIPLKGYGNDSLSGTISWIRQYRNVSEVSEYNDYYNYIAFNGKEYTIEEDNHAVYALADYTSHNRYLINAHARIESAPANNDSWDKFYGVSAGWRFSEESFMKNLQFPGYGVIRAGWNFSDYHPNFDTYYLDVVPDDETRKASSFHAGLDLGLWNDKIRLMMDYYTQKTEVHQHDLWYYIIYGDYSVLVGTNTGYSIKNSGWEFALDYRIIRNKSWNWSMQFNISHNHQYTTDLADYHLNNGKYDIVDNGKYFTYLKNNKSVGSIYGLKNLGVYSTDQDAVARDKDGNVLYDDDGNVKMMSFEGFPFVKGGDTRYKDVNYDGNINNDDLMCLGNVYPKYTGGFGSTVQYQNLSLTFNFHYRLGYKIINDAAMATEGLFSRNNMSKKVLNRWRMQGQHTENMLPRPYIYHNNNFAGSDLYVKSGNFVRLNYISLGYRFSPEICRKLRVGDLSMSLSAQRMLTFSKYDGLDPEIEMGSDDLYWQNKDEFRAIPPKIYTLSVRVTI